MSQNFTSRVKSTIGPALNCRAVVPSDSDDLPNGICRTLYVGTAGTVVFETHDGNIVSLISGDYQYHPIQLKKVLSTGTTADNILALY